MQEITFVLTIASIVVPVIATILTTVYTVINRVKAEHKPYLILDKIGDLDNLDKSHYFITMLGAKLRKKVGSDTEELVKDSGAINCFIKLRNIGYGVAANIRFYDLVTAEKIYGNQEVVDSINQRLYTTFDIASEEEKQVQTSLITATENGVKLEDRVNVLCIYQDLNNNIYDFLFVINIKKGGNYSYYAYQPSSHSYMKLMKKYKKQKRRILSDYKK